MVEKQRLKWTRKLHGQFVEAVSRLGGPDEATPRSMKRMMGIPGLTLQHLKSHLQKYRLAMKRKPEASGNYRREDCMTADCRAEENQTARAYNGGDQTQINEGMLQMQLEVQRKLHEQIEVQRHLQLRIEAERNYLQSVLRKAQEMLISFNRDSAATEAAVDTEQADCADESCLTSCEILPDRSNDKSCKQETGEDSEDISSSVEKHVHNLVDHEPGGGSKDCSISCESNLLLRVCLAVPTDTPITGITVTVKSI